MRLMLLEDNKRLAGFIAKGLRDAGFAVDSLETVADAEAAMATAAYDVVVLDLGLPDMDGMTLLTKIRAKGDSVPVLVVTARDGIGDRVRGLDAGADDYLLKPFAMEEFIARIRALLRRPKPSLDNVLSCGNVALNSSSRELRVDGVLVPLSRREAGLLEQLLRRAENAIPRAALEDRIYGFADEVSPNSLEVIVSRLRKSLRQAKADIEIVTLRNVGYLLRKSDTYTTAGN